MTTQIALALTQVGAPLEKIQIPIPEPKDNEILIKLTATGIAPFDQKLRDLGLFNIGSRLPSILTYDMAGIVHQHSATLSPHFTQKFPIGTQVFTQALLFSSPLSGGLQEYTIIDPTYTAIIPKDIDPLEAVEWPINGVTSFCALFSDEGGPEGKNRGMGIPFPGVEGSEGFGYGGVKLVVLGGGTRCGKLAVQFAHLVGIGTIVTTSSVGGFEELKKLGATHVFDRRLDEKELVGKIRVVVGDQEVYVYDTMTVNDFSFPVSVLEGVQKGTLVRLLHGKVDLKGKEGGVGGMGIRDSQMLGASSAHPKTAKVFWDNIATWIERGMVAGGYDGVVEGLNGEGVNGALDGFRDGGFRRLHVRIC